MKHLILVLALLPGCGWFTSSQVATATAAGIAEVAKIVKEQTGKNLEDVPVNCDVETNPKDKEILMLCTISLKDVGRKL